MVIAVLVVLFAYGEYKKYRTVYDVNTDEERIERYKCLAIPDADFVVKSWDIRTPHSL